MLSRQLALALFPESNRWSYRWVPLGDLPGRIAHLSAGLCSLDVSYCLLPLSRYLVFPQDGEDLCGCNLKVETYTAAFGLPMRRIRRN